MRRLADCNTGAAFAGGGGSAAASIRQPVQQELMQILPLLSSGAGVDCPATSLWQRIAPGSAAASAAARAAPKLPIRLDSAIA